MYVYVYICISVYVLIPHRNLVRVESWPRDETWSMVYRIKCP